MEDTRPTLHYFIISDAIGETAQKVAQSSLVQYPSAHKVCHKYNFISNINDLDIALEDAAAHEGLIFMTMIDNEMAAYAERFFNKHQLTYYNLIQPIVDEIGYRINMKPSKIIGAQHELSDRYFDKIRAMEYCMSFDDGKDPKGFEEADIVLLGVSRTGKTPLSMYLAMLGYKAANLPLIPENELPEILFKLDPNKIVGLTNRVEVINQHRDARMREYGITSPTKYASFDRIQEEFDFAQEVYKRIGCQTLDVSQRSIEESAAIILKMLDLHKHEN